MHLPPDDGQSMLRDSIARFARDSAGAAPEAVAAGLAGLGLWAMALPEAAGGMGGSGRDLMAMMEAAGHGLLPAPLAGPFAALDLLARHGPAALRAEWLGPAMEGAVRLAFARMEVRGEGRLSGRLPLAPGADTAQALVLVSGTSAHLVPLDAPGVRRQALRLADGTGAARLELERAEAAPLPAPAGGIEDSLARATAAACAQMLGVMERMLAETLDHVRTRRQFGTAIGSFQTIQHRMARLYVSVGLCRSVVLAAAEEGHGGGLRHAAAAQALVSERALHLAHDCVQFHGGMGITAELAVSRGHRQLMVLSRLFGPASEARRAFDRLAG